MGKGTLLGLCIVLISCVTTRKEGPRGTTKAEGPSSGVVETASNAAPEVANLSCDNWQISTQPGPEFPDFPRRPQDQQDLAQQNQHLSDEEFIANWVSASIPTTPGDAISVDRLQVVYGGTNNKGIFMVKANGVKIAIAKINFCIEAHRLFKLNQTALVHEQCWLQKLPDFKPEELPHFAKLINAATIDRRATMCLLLLEVAPGREMTELLQGEAKENSPEIFTRLAKVFGAMRKLKVRHSDIRTHNLFYDPISNLITLIDNEGVNIGPPFARDILDLKDVAFGLVRENSEFTWKFRDMSFNSVDDLESSDEHKRMLLKFSQAVESFFAFYDEYSQYLENGERRPLSDSKGYVCKMLKDLETAARAKNLVDLMTHFPSFSKCSP